MRVDSFLTLFQERGINVSRGARDALAVANHGRSSQPNITFTSGVTYNLVTILGTEFRTVLDRVPENILARAKRHGYRQPPAEVGLLLREQFTGVDLGIHHVVVMHEQISNEHPGWFSLNVTPKGRDTLGFWTHIGMHPDTAYVFLAPS